MAPETKLWAADPHTLAKIEIVREYLKAWFPILALSGDHGRVHYVDAFSGPGEYLGGEKGSPIVALETALNHKLDLSLVELSFTFIDKDADRSKHLESLVAKYTLPKNIKVHCVEGSFDETVTQALDNLDAANKVIAPTFLFVDPFGLSQTPFSVIRRFMSNPKCEVMVNFMYPFVNRFKSLLEEQVDELYGTQAWRAVAQLENVPSIRESFMLDVYTAQLRTVAKYVWSFRMLDRKNKTSYYLVYATNHIRGLEKMKAAMWKVSPTGDYSFSDRLAHQSLLFGPDADLSPLRDDIIQQFHGRTISIEELNEFVIVGTNYLPSHLKRRTLVPLEREGLIRVITPRKRALTYPDKTRITFGD